MRTALYVLTRNEFQDGVLSEKKVHTNVNTISALVNEKKGTKTTCMSVLVRAHEKLQKWLPVGR